MKKIFLVLALFSIVTFLAGCSQAKNTGSAIKEGSEEVAHKANQTTLDASITAAVKMKFAHDEVVSARNIDVDTDDGIVTLTGVVTSRAEADRAVQLAWTASGVKNVRSQLAVQR